MTEYLNGLIFSEDLSNVLLVKDSLDRWNGISDKRNLNPYYDPAYKFEDSKFIMMKESHFYEYLDRDICKVASPFITIDDSTNWHQIATLSKRKNAFEYDLFDTINYLYLLTDEVYNINESTSCKLFELNDLPYDIDPDIEFIIHIAIRHHKLDKLYKEKSNPIFGIPTLCESFDIIKNDYMLV